MRQESKDYCLFLCGDVMTGRGIDQILAHPSKPTLYESFVKDARDYVSLAENVNGKITFPVEPNYIWGEALSIWQQIHPDIKIVNLETAITQSDDYWPDKGIHYRMHPQNIEVLSAARIDICTLANNHILDWGYAGLDESLKSLKNAGINSAGAGENKTHAMQPAIIPLSKGKRVLVFAVGMPSSGVISSWEATSNRPGIYYLYDNGDDLLLSVIENVKKYRQPGDLVVFSIHWGSNWGYDIPESFRAFAHALIDEVKIDVIFCHSSHHPRPIEIYKGKPIFYGCGDFINDYEGISGYEEYRGDLSLMYFLYFDSQSLQFKKMILIPMQIKKFSLHRANQEDCQWIFHLFNHFKEFNVPFSLQNKSLIITLL